MQKAIYRNALGAEIVFESAPYLFWKIDGTGLAEVTAIKTQTVGQSGYTLHGTLFESREVTITGHVFGQEGIAKFYEYRKRLNAVCNPLLGLGDLIYHNAFGTWSIPAFVSSIPYDERIGPSQTVEIVFECPSPYWRTADISVASLAYIYGGLHFPIKTPGRFGTLGYRVFIDNDSDVETPVEILMEGGSHNPIILNVTTGDYIKFAKQVNIGESIYINTDPEHMEVTLTTIDPLTNEPVKSQAYGYVTTDSKLFKLARGTNELTFQSDDEMNYSVRLRIAYHKLYVGV